MSPERQPADVGIPETVCMKVSGHKTRNVFDRYITSEKDLADATRKIELSYRQAKIEQVDEKPEAVQDESIQ